MKPLTAYVDSFNFSSNNLEQHFRNENYIIEIVKGIGVFNPSVWIETFKTKLTRNIIEAKILHTHTGLTLPIKRFSVSQDKQTLEIAGLRGYDDKSVYLNELLEELRPLIKDEVITRLDVCIDFKTAIPKRIIRELKKSRQTFNYANSTYFKTASEKKKNYQINILIYPKHKKDNLDYEIERLEFSFMSGYFRNKYQVKNIDEVYKKVEKTIKRYAGLKVQINRLKFSL